MICLTNRLFIILFLLHSFLSTHGQQQDTTDLMLLMNLKAETDASELQRKLNETVGAASKKALSSRETPGIVSIITEEDIRKTGARDMMDVLRLVPGFDFASDINFVTGLALRGAWSIEGKLLVMLDGQELNDLMYQNVAFFNRFPVDLIHRIEIIRGPGSAVYGGTAEYGVINIITKAAANSEGVVASLSFAALPDSYGRKNAQFSVIKNLSKDARVDVSFFRGQAVKSDQNYEELYQSEPAVNLTDITETNTSYANIGFRIKDFRIRSLFEDYKSADPSITTQFRNFFVNARNDFQVNDKLIVTPFIYYTNQVPWKQALYEDGEDQFVINANRVKGGVYGSYDITRKLNIVAGTEYFQDRAESEVDLTYFNGEPTIKFDQYSFYGQALMKHRLVNVTAGFRLDKHSAFGAAFVPRLALTKRFGNFHFKTLASSAYRAPGIDNINIGVDIKPEKSTVLELELGYQLTPDMLISVNGYHIKTKDIIVYYYSEAGEDGYENASRFGTKGIEVSYQFKKSRWNIETNYSYYKVAENTVDRYSVPGNPDAFVGLPQRKLAMIAEVEIFKNLNFGITLNSFSQRYAYTRLDEDDFPEITKLNSYSLLNANLTWRDLFTQGLGLSLGVYDLLNEKPVIPQAYNGDWAPLSGRSRELAVKVTYSIPFTAKK